MEDSGKHQGDKSLSPGDLGEDGIGEGTKETLFPPLGGWELRGWGLGRGPHQLSSCSVQEDGQGNRRAKIMEKNKIEQALPRGLFKIESGGCWEVGPLHSLCLSSQELTCR